MKKVGSKFEPFLEALAEIQKNHVDQEILGDLINLINRLKKKLEEEILSVKENETKRTRNYKIEIKRIKRQIEKLQKKIRKTTIEVIEYEKEVIELEKFEKKYEKLLKITSNEFLIEKKKCSDLTIKYKNNKGKR